MLVRMIILYHGVTTVLSDTGDKTVPIVRRKRVGDEEANRISRESAGLGTQVQCNREIHTRRRIRTQRQQFYIQRWLDSW